MRKLVVLLFLATASSAFSQDWPVKKMVMDKKAKLGPFTNIPAFSFVADKSLGKRGIYQELRLNSSFSKQLLEQKPEAIQVRIPVSSSKSITCELVRFTLGDIKFTQNNSEVIENVKIPVTYRGIISGEKGRNNVTLTVNEDYLSLVATTNDKVLQITKADEKAKSAYRLYNSSGVAFPSASFECGTKELPSSKRADGIDLRGGEDRPASSEDKCVYVFVDCFDSVYIWRGSDSQQTINYVYELFNYVSTGFLNERINILITTINVWKTGTPCRRTVRDTALIDLARYYKDSIWGNICVGLDYSINSPARFGIAGDIGRVKGVPINTCPALGDTVSACCYNDLRYGGNYENFPTGPNTTQAQVYEVIHEIGHLLGSSHTHWCGWLISSGFPLVFGALDNCAPTEGGCPMGPPPPGGKGTIMSYCNGGATLVSFNNGFGVQPGNAMRNFVEQNSCIPSCIVCTGAIFKTSTDNNLAAGFSNSVSSPGHEVELLAMPFRDAVLPVKKDAGFIPKQQR